MDADDTPLMTSGFATPVTAVSIGVDEQLLQARQVSQPELTNLYEGWRLIMSTCDDELPPLREYQVTAELVQSMHNTANSDNRPQGDEEAAEGHDPHSSC